MGPPAASSRLQRGLVLAAVVASVVQVILRNTYLLHMADVYLLDPFQDIANHLRTNMYLQGNYAPVLEEHVHVPVQGSLPADLDGLFIRNGPNNALPTKKRYHWFDGDGMIHSLRIKDGKVVYNNQYIPTPKYMLETKVGKEIFVRLGEVTGISGLLKVLFVGPNVVRNVGLDKLTVGPANTHTFLYNHKFYASVESSLPFEVVLDSNGVIQYAVGYDSFNHTLNYPVSAHAKIDPRTDHLLFHSYSPDPELLAQDGPMKVGEHDPLTNKLVLYQGVGMNHSSFAHDMVFTKHYMIIVDGSLHFNAAKIFQFGASIFDWNDAHTMKLGLVSRSTGSIDWYDTGKALALVHTLTAWEEDDGTVVIWAPVSDKVDIGLTGDHRNLFYMTEFRIAPVTGVVTTTLVSTQHNVEFPRMRDDCLGKACRYGYAAWMNSQANSAESFQGWIGFDLYDKKIVQEVLFGDDEYGGETVVIPKPNSTESNQVYLGAFVHNERENVDYFKLYDGETAELVARLTLPHRVPYGFHGQWIDGNKLEAHVAHHRARKSNRTSE
jgi:carotenoid cleavage dioxygenase-like enzyme